MLKPFQQPRVVALLLVAGATALLWSSSSRAGVTAKPPIVPAQIGLWSGTPLQVSDRAVQILETKDVALMEYRMGQEPPVWFAQVAGFGNRAAFHPPELCYVGSHFEVLERGPIALMVNGRPRRVMRLVINQQDAKSNEQSLEAWYWFTADGRVTPNYYQQQAWLLLDAMRRRPMSGTLVRISTARDEASGAHRRLLAFLTAWEASHDQSPHQNP